MTATQYRIPSPTEASKALVASATEALASDPALTVEEALNLTALPKDDGASTVQEATDALKRAKDTAATFARLRFDAVALAYSTGRVGKGAMYPNQRALASALGMTQGRVSQILKAQSEAEAVRERKSALKDAAKQGGVSDVEGISSTLHHIATDGTPAEIAEAVEALSAGRIPSGPAKTLDVEALVKATERLLTMSGEVINVETDRDAVERVVKMLTTARANLSAAIATKPERVSA
jgi:DNA-binding MarR family transcriptional regulator